METREWKLVVKEHSTLVSSHLYQPSDFEDFISSSRLYGLIVPRKIKRLVKGSKGKGVSIVYPRFDILVDLPKKKPRKIFPKFIKGVITALLRMLDAKMDFKISLESIVLTEFEEGSVLPSLPLRFLQTQSTNHFAHQVFVTLESLLRTVLPKRLPSSIEMFLSCFSLADSDIKRHRLLQSPIFMSDIDLVWVLLPHLYLGALHCNEFEEILKENLVEDWKKKVDSSNNLEAWAVMEGGGYEDDTMLSVVRFGKNLIFHGKEKWFTLKQLQEIRNRFLIRSAQYKITYNDVKTILEEVPVNLIGCQPKVGSNRGGLSQTRVMQILKIPVYSSFHYTLDNITNKGLLVGACCETCDFRSVLNMMTSLKPDFFEVVFNLSFSVDTPISPIDAPFLKMLEENKAAGTGLA